MKRIRQRRWFDGHLHLRQGDMLKAVAKHSARRCAAAVIMPNTNPFITTPELALTYEATILVETGPEFTPVMTGYLTEDMDPAEITRGFEMDAWKAMKVYPYGLTTNSHGGIKDLRNCARHLEVMQEIGMPCLLHGERAAHPKTGEQYDIFDREAAFIEHDLTWAMDTFPEQIFVLEHISTREGASYVALEGGGGRLYASITAHHLDRNRNDLFEGGMNPKLNCMPVLKRKEHQRALCELVQKRFLFVYAGTDSAPHPRSAKEKACGCAAGIFTADCATELYLEILDDLEALDYADDFLSKNACELFGIDPSEEYFDVVGEEWRQDPLISDREAAIDIPSYGWHPIPELERKFRFKAL